MTVQRSASAPENRYRSKQPNSQEVSRRRISVTELNPAENREPRHSRAALGILICTSAE